MPNSLDRSWTTLMESLDDNNEGAITEEDLRAVGAYSRHSTFEQAFGYDPGVEIGNAEDWGDFPEPNTGVPYLPLQSLRGGAAEIYQHYTGHLAEVSGVGVRYITGNPLTTGVTQARQFIVNWNISLESPYNTLWGVSFWRLANGGTWPSPGDAWDPDKIFPLTGPQRVSSVLAKVVNDANVWGSERSGSFMATLDPGDTIVPLLEFLGTFDSTAAIPQGTLRAFTLKVASAGPVEDDWESAPDLGTASSLWTLTAGDEIRESLASGTDLVPTGGSRQQLIILPTDQSLPTTGNYNGRFYWDEETEKLYIWKDNDWLVYSPDTPYSMPSVTTRPTTGLYEGQWVYETSTKQALLYTNESWVAFNSSARTGYRTGPVSLARVSGPEWNFTTGTVAFAKYEQGGAVVNVRIRGVYSAAGTGGFSRIDATGLPDPADSTYVGALFGQLEDASSAGGERYPLSGQVRFVTGSTNAFQLRPSTAAGELIFNSPITLATDDSLVMQFTYITNELVS
jgi:hypothetical protein